jgi:hypothetical protein
MARDGLHLYIKDLWGKPVGDGSSHHYKDPTGRGERSKRWLNLYIKDLGVKLVGDGSSHHYKDPTRRGERSKRWLHRYIKDLGLNSWEMGVLTITRIPPEGEKEARDGCIGISRIWG